jgi:hypothetical protein
MKPAARDASASQTLVLLIEADADARDRHEVLLASVGYAVRSLPALPDAVEVQSSAVIIADLASFHRLRAQQFDGRRPILVITEDCSSGATACLCGATDWIPTYGAPDYFLSTLADTLHLRGISTDTLRSRNGIPSATHF